MSASDHKISFSWALGIVLALGGGAARGLEIDPRIARGVPAQDYRYDGLELLLRGRVRLGRKSELSTILEPAIGAGALLVRFGRWRLRCLCWRRPGLCSGRPLLDRFL